MVRTPAASTRSLRAIGMPWSGPFHRPRWISASASRASTSAESAVTLMNAFSSGLSYSMRPRHSRPSSSLKEFLTHITTLSAGAANTAQPVETEQFSLPFRFFENHATPFRIKTALFGRGSFQRYAEGRAKTSMIGIWPVQEFPIKSCPRTPSNL
jgi:hypothetical protein